MVGSTKVGRGPRSSCGGRGSSSRVGIVVLARTACYRKRATRLSPRDSGQPPVDFIRADFRRRERVCRGCRALTWRMPDRACNPAGRPYRRAACPELAACSDRAGTHGRLHRIAPGSHPIEIRANRETSQPLDSSGGRAEARTPDPLIKSQLLYQLSYAPDPPEAKGGRTRTPWCASTNASPPTSPARSGT